MVQSFYMERLPYIDRHERLIRAASQPTWLALLGMLGARGAHVPALAVRALALDQATLSGDWRAGRVQAGDTLPGFAVAEARAPELLALRGGHRFSRYALTFELREHQAGCVIIASTWAAFPGLLGRGYRALVIGSGLHRVAVGAMLRDVERRV
jgi:hypothetical protein